MQNRKCFFKICNELWFYFKIEFIFVFISSAFITSNLNNEYYPPKDVPIKMTLVPVNPTELSDGQVKLGEKVKLKIEILKKLRGKIIFL